MHYYFIFYGNNILLKKETDGGFSIPLAAVPPLMAGNPAVLDAGTLDGLACRTYGIGENEEVPSGYEFCDLRQSYYKLSEKFYVKAGKCKELVYWHENNLYCGRCGNLLEFSSPISKKCANCGKEIWPLLATAIIVLIHKGDEVLLVHAHNFKGNFYGLVAGFVETGENLEEAVAREVMEETGLTVKNIRYFGSQPWPYPCGLMVGFHADYHSGTLKLQKEELSEGSWFTKDNLPNIPEKLSIARKLIDDWLGK